MAWGWLPPVLSGLTELVLPGGCPGCDQLGEQPLRQGVCPDCVGVLDRLRAGVARPEPVPPGFPPCTALGEYAGVLRELILAYKDGGRHRLARPLGRLLAEAVAGGLAGPAAPGRVLLVPVPDTPVAARARHGDHLRRLAGPAAARLRAAGIEATVAGPLRARPRPDSTGLGARGRAAAAASSLRTRPGRVAGMRHRLARTGEPVILLDDVVTTGATLAVAAARLAAAGIPVAGAAVLAATRRTHPPSGPE